jgi:choline dehydrogenase
MAERETYDYIIVGGGAAGCVVANRLSANPAVNVLLIEAGDLDIDPAIKETAVTKLFSLWKPELNWGLETEPEPYCNNVKKPLIQGRVLGGGSTLNGRIFIRGHRLDFDNWAHLGNEGWSYKDVLPYFKKLEDFEGGASEFRGVGGPVRISKLKDASPTALAWIEGTKQLGFGGDADFDYNGEKQDGTSALTQSNTTVDGKRASTALAYIHPIMNRKNFTLKTSAEVTKILMEGNKAVGIEYAVNTGRIGAELKNKPELKKAYASSEVILSAGPYQSPKILMLSGIGGEAQLKAHNIPVVVNLPGVGENLQDHIVGRIAYRFKSTTDLSKQNIPSIISETSFLTYSRSGLEGTASPDIQVFVGGFMFPDVSPDAGFTIVPANVQAQGVGTVKLKSANPFDNPLVLHNYFKCDRDLETLVTAFKLAQEVIHTKAFDELRGEELLPGPDSKSDASLKEYLRNRCFTNWHPSSSNKMGYDSMAVVDPRLKVHGVEGLRVIDASIMPFIVNCNLHATCVMIGEKGADLVIADQ